MSADSQSIFFAEGTKPPYTLRVAAIDGSSSRALSTALARPLFVIVHGGTRALVESNSGSLQLIDVDSGRSITMAPDIRADIYGLRESDEFLMAKRGIELVAVDLAEGQVTRLSSRSNFHASVSPDGVHAAFIEAGNDQGVGTLVITSLRDGSRKTWLNYVDSPRWIGDRVVVTRRGRDSTDDARPLGIYAITP